ncbi:hypothetical protein BKD09_24000 [Bradyrhizobium japonicum]|uniref:Uncharacterized protein n=1 Tax=Bradyrhizobium japonicum TaxID=375 RepID=A0A1L3FDQ3_BRAJP|nr:hypothetical protein [Bradyrhizobium japonicum]APG11401.1 hypothetical protein BKD09_24000 [Bradyrhizobium japonicum]
MGSEEDETESMAIGFLQSQKVNWAAGYIERGRRFGAMTDEAVRGQWLASMKAMGDDATDKSARDWNNDAEAELTLRKLDPPFAAGNDDVNRFLAASKKRVDELMADPVERERIENSLIEDLKAFGEGTERSN